ncbi:MAG: FAD/FMN-containing dehydrogenase [uncultured bacterium]|nr:MAG: FAD/FMN-containing dehydrogenase [uncultured bacterium]
MDNKGKKIEINKISQVATFDPDLTIGEVDRLLSLEGFLSGYCPLEGIQLNLQTCALQRKPNLYFLKYGGMEDLCTGGVFKTKAGKRIVLKHVPRSAAGADLKRVFIGSAEHLGQFEELTLKIFSIPEFEAWGVVFFEHERESLKFIRAIYSQGLRPLFLKIANDAECSGVCRSLNLMRNYECGVVIKLSGLKGMVQAEKRMIEQYMNIIDIHWTSRSAESEILEETIVNGESLTQVLSKTEALFMGTDLKISVPEKKLIHFIEKALC